MLVVVFLDAVHGAVNGVVWEVGNGVTSPELTESRVCRTYCRAM